MKELRETTALACPVEEAEAGLLAFFAARQDTDGITRMRLRVPMDGTMALEREVRVEARETRDDENLNELIRIAWEPQGAVIFPRFEGTLTVWGEDDPGGSFVELRGHYTPPLGAAGQVFDDAIGFRIAKTTANEFLRDVKREIERRARAKRE
ncbi:MAG TPA: hypothetical protein VMA98_08165 [Candidatus Acidoferrales bacterium]|nr:hypothetical protein [Candidatus Acidoferrales bacterium]